MLVVLLTTVLLDAGRVATASDRVAIRFSDLDPHANEQASVFAARLDEAAAESSRRGNPWFGTRNRIDTRAKYLRSRPVVVTQDGVEAAGVGFLYTVRITVRGYQRTPVGDAKVGHGVLQCLVEFVALPRVVDGRVELQMSGRVLDHQKVRYDNVEDHHLDTALAKVREAVGPGLPSIQPIMLPRFGEWTVPVTISVEADRLVGELGQPDDDGWANADFEVGEHGPPSYWPGGAYLADRSIPEGEVWLYRNGNFGSSVWKVNLSELGCGGAWDARTVDVRTPDIRLNVDNRPSSVRWRIPRGQRVILAAHPDGSGPTVTLTGSGEIADLGEVNFDGSFSYVRLDCP